MSGDEVHEVHVKSVLDNNYICDILNCLKTKDHHPRHQPNLFPVAIHFTSCGSSISSIIQLWHQVLNSGSIFTPTFTSIRTLSSTEEKSEKRPCQDPWTKWTWRSEQHWDLHGSRPRSLLLEVHPVYSHSWSQPVQRWKSLHMYWSVICPSMICGKGTILPHAESS